MASCNITGLRRLMIACIVIVLVACNESSSPEGRMNIKMGDLQKEMIDSLKTQNRAILDSLSRIREDLRRLEQRK